MSDEEELGYSSSETLVFETVEEYRDYLSQKLDLDTDTTSTDSDTADEDDIDESRYGRAP